MLKSVHNCEKRRILLKFKIVEKINLFSEQNDADCNDVKEDTYDPDWCKPKCTQMKYLQ